VLLRVLRREVRSCLGAGRDVVILCDDSSGFVKPGSTSLDTGGVRDRLRETGMSLRVVTCENVEG
jgi:hypothetical protein